MAASSGARSFQPFAHVAQNGAVVDHAAGLEVGALDRTRRSDLDERARWDDYQQALYLMNQETFLTNNFLIAKEDNRISSPVGVVYFEHYQNQESLQSKLESIGDKLQCMVKKGGEINFGQAQMPSISDFADGVDTMEFLSKLR